MLNKGDQREVSKLGLVFCLWPTWFNSYAMGADTLTNGTPLELTIRR